MKTILFWTNLGLFASLAFLTMTLSGCVPVAISHALATTQDTKIIETMRRAYVVHRRADGKSDKQIASEIAEIDRAWEIDLALSHGDLMASTKPHQLIAYDCYTEAHDSQCEAKEEEQARILAEAEIVLAPEDWH